jgi:hypothetical protein
VVAWLKEAVAKETCKKPLLCVYVFFAQEGITLLFIA